MSFEIRDCLDDVQISIESTKEKADSICAIHGGADNCIHVFEVEEPEIKPVKVEEIKEQKPLEGMLF